MTKPLYVHVVAFCLVAACSSSAHQAKPVDPQQMPKGTNVNPDAGLIAHFKKRVDEYAGLRKKAESAAPVEGKQNRKPPEGGVAE